MPTFSIEMPPPRGKATGAELTLLWPCRRHASAAPPAHATPRGPILAPGAPQLVLSTCRGVTVVFAPVSAQETRAGHPQCPAAGVPVPTRPLRSHAGQRAAAWSARSWDPDPRWAADQALPSLSTREPEPLRGAHLTPVAVGAPDVSRGCDARGRLPHVGVLSCEMGPCLARRCDKV